MNVKLNIVYDGVFKKNLKTSRLLMTLVKMFASIGN